MLSVLVWWLAIQGLALLPCPSPTGCCASCPIGVSMARPVGLSGGYGLWIW